MEVPRDNYKHFCTIQTRWMDNDIYGHVNNVQYYSFFDSAINQYLITEGGLDIAGGDVIGIAAETHCQFLNSISFPGVVEVGLSVGKLGNSSVRYDLAIFKKDDAEAAAVGWFVHVFVNRETRRAVPMPDRLRRSLELLAAPEM